MDCLLNFVIWKDPGALPGCSISCQTVINKMSVDTLLLKKHWQVTLSDLFYIKLIRKLK